METCLGDDPIVGLWDINFSLIFNSPSTSFLIDLKTPLFCVYTLFGLNSCVLYSVDHEKGQ